MRQWIKSKILLFTVIMTLVIQPYFNVTFVNAATANNSNYKIRILELQPSRTFKLSSSNLAGAELTQLSMQEFVAKRESLIGKYDIIYVGVESGKYSTLGAATTKNPAPSNGSNNGTKINGFTNYKVYEYYSGNDITNLKADEIDAFITAGHMVVFDSRIFTSGTSNNSKVYSRFLNYYSNQNKVNVVFKSSSNDCKSAIEGYSTDFTSFSAKSKLRPYLKLISGPKEFDGTSSSYQANGIVTYKFDALSYTNTDATFDINLYFDINGDLSYKASDEELLKTTYNVKGNSNLTMSLAIPDGYTGLMPWKLEIVDKATGAKNYILGNTAYKGTQKLDINVLQVSPSGTTLSIKTGLKDAAGKSYLTSDIYNIDVDEISISTFNSKYNNSNFTLSEYRNSQGEKYNMIIFGFADTYGGGDIASEKIANDIKAFINTGQSVMLTHDTITFAINGTSGWGYNFTKYLRDYVGQNIYPTTASMPKYPSFMTLGFSDASFLRAEGKGFATVNTVTTINNGLLTDFPYNLSQDVPVAPTHYQYYQLDLERENLVVWYTLSSTDSKINKYNPANYYYTYSVGNVTYSGTGHSSLSSNVSYPERQLFVNTIIKAARGSNFAPTVQIVGIENNQNISASKETLEFSILAKDPDIKDAMLNAKVYLDKDGDGVYEDNEVVKEYKISDGTALENGISKNVTIDLYDEDENSIFIGNPTLTGIKVIVYDGQTYGQGASNSDEKKLNRVYMPVLAASVTGKSGCLIGDEVSIATKLKLELPPNTTNTTISNITLIEKLYEGSDATGTLLNSTNSKLDVTQYTSWTKNTSDFTAQGLVNIQNTKTAPTWVEKNYTIKVEPLEVGNYFLNAELDYKVDSTNLWDGANVGFTLGVKKGQIGITLKDETGVTISDTVQLHLIRTKDADGNVLSAQEELYDLGVIGEITFGDTSDEVLPSGTYIVKTDATSEYTQYESSEFVLNYDNSLRVIDVVLQSEPVKNVELTHIGTIYNDSGIRYLNDDGVGQFSLTFTTIKDIKSIEFNFVNASGFIFDAGTLVVKTDDGTDVTSKFSCSDEGELIGLDNVKLSEDTYIATLGVKFPDAAIQGATGTIGVSTTVKIKAVNDVENNYTISPVGTLLFKYDNVAPTILSKVSALELKNSGKLPLKTENDGTGSNIVISKWLLGDKTLTDFEDVSGNLIGSDFTTFKSGDTTITMTTYVEKPTISVEVTNNATYTVYTKDEAGNEAFQVIVIQLELPDLL